jgi:hypothetical protein
MTAAFQLLAALAKQATGVPEAKAAEFTSAVREGLALALSPVLVRLPLVCAAACMRSLLNVTECARLRACV